MVFILIETMVFYLIGLGLGDAKDISLRGMEIVKQCDEVYLETYTSVLCGQSSAAHLSEFYGRPVLEADRQLVELRLEQCVSEGGATRDLALLVVGDPLSATTHQELVLHARQSGVTCRVLHNASVLTAVARCGLQLYRCGETVSLPFWTDTWRPRSFLDKIEANLSRGLHTLCLLDIRVHEVTQECLARGRSDQYEPPRFMTAVEAASQLLQALSDRLSADGPTPDTKVVSEGRLTPNTEVVALARLGSEEERVVSATLAEMEHVDMGPPLHSLIVVGDTHPLEQQFLQLLRLESSQLKQ